MIRINQIKCLPDHSPEDLQKQVIQTLKVNPGEIISFQIAKRSIDARKKPQIWFTYSVDVILKDEKNYLKKNKNPNVVINENQEYFFPNTGNKPLDTPPVIIGMGPAGLFCGYMLAKEGYRPIIIERGEPVEDRSLTVDKFWNTGILNKNSNVQFGEGGAGTFSDGKLNTLVKDKFGRNRKVLEIFVENGAPKEILYENKPHIGTDILTGVVINMRKAILSWGGRIDFNSQVIDLKYKDNSIESISVLNHLTDKTSEINTKQVILAIGHSARDTFRMLYEKKIPMEAKSFAVGLRVEHPQPMITVNQYGKIDENLPTADYKLTAEPTEERGVYSFCMCPGGYVVNASSQEKRLAVNGMSYSKRDGKNANSAIIVAVTPADFPSEGPLSGVLFQEKLEEKAYEIGQGKVPVETYRDFYKEVTGTEYVYKENQRNATSFKQHFTNFTPSILGEYSFGKVSSIMPGNLNETFIKAMELFERTIPGFAYPEVLLSGIESRTSSPVRISRDENKESAIKGLYPCGEGAGYAGGIMSAAMDGLVIAEEIGKKFKRF